MAPNSSPPYRATRSAARASVFVEGHRDGPQAFVAGDVAVEVVESFEVVDVDHENRERLPVSATPAPLDLEAFVEDTAVGDPGERVGRRRALETFVGLFEQFRGLEEAVVESALFDGQGELTGDSRKETGVLFGVDVGGLAGKEKKADLVPHRLEGNRHARPHPLLDDGSGRIRLRMSFEVRAPGR